MEFGFFYMNIIVPGGSLFGDSGTLWANGGISKSLFEDRVKVSLSVKNLFDSGGFRLNITKPLYDGSEYFADELTDVNMNRHPRTITLDVKFRFGQLQEEKRESRRGQNGGENGMMDMGF